MKKVLCFIIAFMLMPCMVYAVDVSAESAILYDSVSGKVLYEKNADKKSLIASTTKIMTGLLSVELYDLDESVVIDRQWCGIEGSSMYLAAGETITIRDLLYGLMLMSGNDAAQALSCLYTGDSKDFVDLMNKRAKEIGLTDTHFSNPSRRMKWRRCSHRIPL